ncbi:4-hydroxybenzoate octaprenyltransferase [Hydrogenophaga sp.]|uniref:4-hydroxybenzoate octaprenyltransferase n=1 Tax=Hydrogenophaga sp. TaxID=1904254 RepID=UPI0019C49815|nr:4-hydroxybenzoate octaprenyltransferase [Hydrogenophaga sp.]MBD3893402.1 4-hydroxybenzoate octaprenyltransferase [Hydrogenophaga sp.]
MSTPAPEHPRPAQRVLTRQALRRRLALYLDLIRWNRPAGWLLLLWPSLSALWVAAGGFPGWHLLAVFVLGTILMRSAGCCVNDVADRHFDRHVKRTAQRPLTSGRISVPEALALAALLALAAFALVLSTNLAVLVWSVLGMVLTLAYPYAKRHVCMPQAVLGLAFSFGIVLAFAAVRAGPAVDSFSAAATWVEPGFWGAVWHSVPPLAWLLLAGNLFWVLAYDTEYAMVDRDDDLRIGIKTSAITLGAADVPAILAFYLIFLVIWTVALGPLLNPWVWGATLLLALAQVAWHFSLIRQRRREACFKAFVLNHWLGLTVFAGVVLGL